MKQVLKNIFFVVCSFNFSIASHRPPCHSKQSLRNNTNKTGIPYTKKMLTIYHQVDSNHMRPSKCVAKYSNKFRNIIRIFRVNTATTTKNHIDLYSMCVNMYFRSRIFFQKRDVMADHTRAHMIKYCILFVSLMSTYSR